MKGNALPVLLVIVLGSTAVVLLMLAILQVLRMMAHRTGRYDNVLPFLILSPSNYDEIGRSALKRFVRLMGWATLVGATSLFVGSQL